MPQNKSTLIDLEQNQPYILQFMPIELVLNISRENEDEETHNIRLSQYIAFNNEEEWMTKKTN